jgi:hypothetical protein
VVSNLNPDQFEKYEIPASEAKVGDRTDISLKARIHAVAVRPDGRVVHAYKVRGSKAPGVRFYDKDETVKVWRKKT